MKTVLIDDSPIDLASLKNFCEKSGLVEVVGCFNQVNEALAFLSNIQVDLLITDVDMPDLNGYKLFETLTIKPLIILQSAYPSYAAEGFDINAIDFLVKPVSYERLIKAINKAGEIYKKKNHISNQSYFFIKNRNGLIKVNPEELMYIESDENYCNLYTSNGEKLVAIISLRKAQELLGIDFLRIHRGCVVNMQYCRKINSESILLNNGKELPLGQTFKKDLEDIYLKNNIWQR